MKTLSHTLLNELNDNRFIEVYKLQNAADAVFNNYVRYNFHQIIWFTQVGNKNSLSLDFEDHKISDDEIVIVYPGQIVMLDIRDKEGYLFAVDNESFFDINQHLQSDYLNGYYSNVFIIPDADTKETLNKLMVLIAGECENQNRVKLMKSYMEAFLFHLTALFANDKRSENMPDRTIVELLRLADSSFITERDTDFYAARMGLSNKKVNEIFAKATGKTIKQYLHERLVLEMKKEIRLGTKSLKEISFDLGFSEPAYFTRFFKLQTGMTPSEFKAKTDDLSK
ncbi:AraC family transcriptional regulator [Bacteroides sp. 519]|uniref:helix-turn-helix domain-containing protein n=1 Tax=Bacteroides sp. 519 TaxID=2302937 RepID=UPI0013D4DC5C|nr:helix-turn-helix domain-containing protein [Bacteroides sp. 519]NDV59427.1 AraC family transcriptional regulator [Bacteroides sp. 519]